MQGHSGTLLGVPGSCHFALAPVPADEPLTASDLEEEIMVEGPSGTPEVHAEHLDTLWPLEQ